VLALTHLGALLHGASPTRTLNSRVLVLGGQYTRLRCGVLVDSVAGLRTIKSVEPLASPKHGAVSQGKDATDGLWTLLDIQRVVSATSFFDVGVMSGAPVLNHG
jgi:chemotaxis signal transduction protein